MNHKALFFLGAFLVLNIGVHAQEPTVYSNAGSPPVIYQQPQSLTVTAPAVATFYVYAGGDPYPKFQWYRNNVAIKGATDYSYTTMETTTTDNGAKYYVTIKNSAGSVKSNTVTLTVKPYNGTGKYPIVGEWSGTAIITDPSGSTTKPQVVAGFTQNSYSLVGTIVFVGDEGIPEMGAGIASLNSLNLFTAPDIGGDTVDIAAAFSSNLLSLSGGGLVSGGGPDSDLVETGSGTLTLSSDHKKLTGSATTSDGTKVSWTLTRIK